MPWHRVGFYEVLPLKKDVWLDPAFACESTVSGWASAVLPGFTNLLLIEASCVEG